jgi:pimeloyl-ACP methyl ester carboxylesterase
VKITVGNAEIGYDRTGSGEPVILVMGLGTPRIGWFNQFHFLSQSYDVICYDNRGCGETVCAAGWTMQDMASDAIALADAAGFESFHLVGISMGGMISQELVLTWPDRVRTLTLIATTPGGPEAVPMSPEFAAAMLIADPDERTKKTMELTFGEKFRRSNPEIMQLITSTVMTGIPGMGSLGDAGSGTEGFFGQLGAVATWMGAGGAAHALKDIEHPALVMHGGEDKLLPVGNGHILARDIAGARLRIWDDAGHALNAEAADEVNAELVAHFESASARV